MRKTFPALRLFCMAIALLLVPETSALAKETSEIGEKIADAFNKQDVETLFAVMDIDALAGKLSAEQGLRGSAAQNFEDGLRKGVRNNIESGLRQFAQKEGIAKYIRSGARKGKRFALVRIQFTSGDGGFEYVEYYLSPKNKVEDWYTHSQGSRVSTSIRLAMSSMMKKDSILTVLFGIDKVNESEVKRFKEFSSAIAAGDYPKAYQAMEALPESYRKTREWAMMRASIASFNESAHRASLEHLARNFGGDDSVQFMLIDHYYYQERYDLAHKAVTLFEKSIGGEDAVTGFLKCSSLISGKQYEEAVKACRRGIEREPDFQNAYWGVVTAGLQSKNPKLALAGLTAYEKAFNMEFDPDKLAQIDEYRELGRTPEFATWAKPRRGVKK
jgi:tetratricopeptide (TPR) repeat protein